MNKAVERWHEEAASDHTFLLHDLRTRLASVAGAQPSHLEHVETCIQVLGDALRCPTGHLDLSLLPPGHALSSDDMCMFAQRRALLHPPLRSITLPARCTHLPEFLGLFDHLTHVNAPDYAGTLNDLGMRAHWRAIQLGCLQAGEVPVGSGIARGEPTPDAPAHLELVLRPAADDLDHQAFSRHAMRFVRHHPVGTPGRAAAVQLASTLTHAVQWHCPTLDLSSHEASLLQRAAHHGLFTAFNAAHAKPGAHAIQSAHRGTTQYVAAACIALNVVLPPGLGSLPGWLAELEGVHGLDVKDLPAGAFNPLLCPGLRELHIAGQPGPVPVPPGCRVHWWS